MGWDAAPIRAIELASSPFWRRKGRFPAAERLSRILLHWKPGAYGRLLLREEPPKSVLVGRSTFVESLHLECCYVG
ncbi:hypothetical protein HPP92_020283 [Vanilla planifolia]|uniref:Uncharacterized protein n=1 Tax=Vanilla planifolia TaxID=51239 RepID=A0A835UIC0_VANPL|nr:hypothetical protein HPP92_020283 [Vanilla planifolia]